MCFSFEASFVAWLFGVAGGYILYQRNNKFDRWNAYFIWTFTLIQLLEAGLWLVVGKTDRHSIMINQFLTFMILVALLLQPTVQVWEKAKYSGNTVDAIIAGFFLLAALVIPSLTILNKTPLYTTVGEKGHLVWHNVVSSMGIHKYLYMLGLFLPLLFMGTLGYLLIGIGLLTFAYSWYTTRGNEFSSMWCFTSIAYIAVALIFG